MPLDPQAIENTLAFLRRVNLTGEEVPAFVDATNKLHEHRQVLLLQAQNATPTPTEDKPE